MKKIATSLLKITIALSILYINGFHVLAIEVLDTFTQGDFTFEVQTKGDSTNHGAVGIKDYDENSSTTDLIIPNTVEHEGIVYDVVSFGENAFDNADKVVSVHFPENLVTFPKSASTFIAFDNLNISTSLKTITVDPNNTALKLIDGVLYNMSAGKERLALYPYASEQEAYVIPEYFCKNNISTDDILIGLLYAYNLASIETAIPSQNEFFTENGILYSWVKAGDHSLGSSLLILPPKMKHPVFSKTVTDIGSLDDRFYVFANEALDFSFVPGGVYQAVDGNIYLNDQLILTPGGRNKPIYSIPESTKIIGDGAAAFFANKNLKSIIIPETVNEVSGIAFASETLKSIMIKGEGNITWDSDSLTSYDGAMKVHVYVEHGNTTVKAKMQQVFSQLNDSYFHELGEVPTTIVSGLKTSIENKKDVKLTWNAVKADVNYEVRRYDKNGEYTVVASTKENQVVDQTTTYDTTYKYVVVPYTLPLTSSNDKEDPMYDYHTFGTPSDEVSVKTPVQSFTGTYTYKLADGTQTSITKSINLNESALDNAPVLPNVSGFEFEGWTTNLKDPQHVDKDFTATATYKVIDSKPETPDKPDDSNKPQDPDASEKPNDPSTPENPDASEKPNDPSTPENPDTSEKPNDPSTPENSDASDKPNDPSTPENPDTSNPSDNSQGTTKPNDINNTKDSKDTVITNTSNDTNNKSMVIVLLSVIMLSGFASFMLNGKHRKVKK